MAETKLIREIRRRMEALGFNPRSLSLKAKLGPTAVRDIFNGHIPKLSTLEKLAKALACTVADLTGEQLRTPIVSGDSVRIFEVRTYGQAGPGGSGELEITSEQAVGEFVFPATGFRQRFGAAPDAVFIDEVRGDSQMPTLFPGQPVMIDGRDRKPSPPGMFLCWDGIGMVFKRIEVIPNSEPLKVRLISDNKAYDSYERLAEEVFIYGRVLGRWDRM